MEAAISITSEARLLRRRLQRKYILKFVRRKRSVDSELTFIGGPP